MNTESFGRKTLELLGIVNELPLTAVEQEEYIRRLGLLVDDQKFIFTHFYGNLDVLDNKTNSMIQAGSVTTAIYALAVPYFLQKDIKLSWIIRINPIEMVIHFNWAFYLGAILAFSSLLLFLIVERVHWSSNDDLIDKNVQALRLLRIRNKRTIRYRIAWNLSFASYILLAFSIYLLMMNY